MALRTVLRSLVYSLVLLALVVTAFACKNDQAVGLATGGGGGGGTPRTFVGVAASAGTESGAVSLTATPPALSGSSSDTVTGTFALRGASAVTLAGTLDTSAGVLSASGNGYAVTATLSSGALRGTYTGPTGQTGSFVALEGTAASVTALCGTYSGTSAGLVDFVSGSAGVSGVVSNTAGSATTSGTLSGSSLSMTATGGTVFTGTLTGGSANGTWVNGGDSGTWQAASCSAP